MVQATAKKQGSASPVSLNDRLLLATALADQRILANICSVSRSGMSRKMQFVVASSRQGTSRVTFMRVTHLIAQIVGYRYNTDDRTLKKDGCGSDAVHDVICNLVYVLRQDEELLAELSVAWECDTQEASARLEEATRQSVFCL